MEALKTDLLDYELPEAAIAARPTERRDGARLVVLGSSALEHRRVAEWPELVPEGALVVLNETRVLKARLLGARRATGGKAEILLLRRDAGARAGDEERWTAFGRASKPLRPGAIVDAGPIEVRVIERGERGELLVQVRAPGGVEAALERHGRVPIPPYLKRPDDADDAERYQTVYARRAGSVAAPTAGLHLSHELLGKLEARGEIGKVVLHVGAGTFQPVTAEDLDQHPMHSERFEVDARLAERVRAARERGAPVVAVGTTVVRALESARDPHRPGQVRPSSGETRLMIQPGYAFSVVDALLTNFHMPRSTLLALVAAFAGRERVLAAYREALAAGYRFLSYGDAMWMPERLA